MNVTMSATSESAPLLKQAAVGNTNAQGIEGGFTDYDTLPPYQVTKTCHGQPSWKQEAILLTRSSAPLVVTYILQYSYMVVTVVVAGRLGTSELAAASLGTMTANITGIAIYEGLATSLDTLTSQAFGADKKHLVGLHVQRMIALILLTTIPIGIIWICSPWILASIVPQTNVAYLAGDFLRFYLIGAPGYGVFEAAKRFTQAQGDFTGPMVTALICAPLNIFWNWLLVFKLGLGFRGAAIAVSITMHTQPLVFLGYIRMLNPATLQCWPGLNWKRIFQNWAPMLRLSLPGVVAILSEWLAFDILTLSSSYLSESHLAAQSALITTGTLMYHFSFPVAIAASTRFGNLIGQGDLVSARVAFNFYYMVFAGIIGFFNMTLLILFRKVVATMFSKDPIVEALIIRILPIVAAAQLFDALCALSQALTRGLGRQKIAGWTSLCVYYLFAIPLSLLLTFGPPKMGLLGLWIGPVSGIATTSLILYLYMRCTNWERAVQEARDREE